MLAWKHFVGISSFGGIQGTKEGGCFNLSHCYRVIKDEEKFKAQYAALKACWGKKALDDVGEGEPGTAAGEDQLQEGGQARCGHQRLDRKRGRHDE